MPLDKSALFGFLEEVDKELDKPVTLVAVGGTALTLLDAKPSTRDVDFTLPSVDYVEFNKVLKRIPHGFEVQCWKDCQVFSQFLPDDCIKKSVPIRKTKNIDLRALRPVDIVVTKIGRLEPKDKQDIESCIRRFHLTKREIARRAKDVEYVGREENYRINLTYVLDNFFD